MPQIQVRRALPQADAHLEAVRAALLDGRLDLAAWAVRANVTEPTARRWAEGHRIQDSWEGHAWGAAVTTIIPGWASHLAAVGPVAVPDDAEPTAQPESLSALFWGSLLASARALHDVGELDSPSLRALEARAAAVRPPFAPHPDDTGPDARA